MENKEWQLGLSEWRPGPGLPVEKSNFQEEHQAQANPPQGLDDLHIWPLTRAFGKKLTKKTKTNKATDKSKNHYNYATDEAVSRYVSRWLIGVADR